MKYCKEERLEIGRRIFIGELSVAMAAVEYDINIYTARDYLRLYKANENLIVPKEYRSSNKGQDETLIDKTNLNQYESMSKKELLDELAKAKIEAARAKKGYEVKGDGRSKVYIPINNKNSK